MFQLRDRMAMRVDCVRHEMVVAVGMRDSVRMDAAVVGMRVGMLMRMRVAPDERVDDDERRTGNHDGERGEVYPRQAFLQQQKREKRPDERRYRVVGARLRRAKRVLGAHVQEDAEPVGNKAENKRGGDVREARHRLVLCTRDGKRAQPGEHAFEYDDLVCALRRDVARAVVLESPADRRRNDKQRAVRELEAVRAFERKDGARKSDERDCRSQAQYNFLRPY